MMRFIDPVAKQGIYQCFLILCGVGIASTPMPANADLLLPGRCHMGHCYEMSVKDKRPLRKTSSGILYEIRRATRSWKHLSSENPKSIPFGKYSILYVHCSTKRPAVIHKDNAAPYDYLATLLNPNGRDYYGYNMSTYSIYWGICHNISNDIWSEEMVSRSISLGYPGNLQQEQIQIRHPLDIDR